MKRFLNFALPTLALALMPIQSMADMTATPVGFLKHFKIRRDAAGKLQTISLESKAGGLSLRLILEELKKDIQAVQGTLKMTNAENLVAELDEVSYEGWPADYRRLAIQSISALEKLDVDAAFADSKFQDVIRKFEAELNGSAPFYKVMAAPNNPTYFYQRAVLSAIVHQVLSYAKKTLGNVPILSVVTFVIERAEHMIVQRRAFHHNLMLHYLENFEAEQLTLTEKEVSLIRSSIYESKIPANQIWVSRYAKKNWDSYGELNFASDIGTSNATLKIARGGARYEKLEGRLNYAFQIVTQKGTRKIVNLYDRRFMFSTWPSDAYIFTSPKKVERQRRLLRLTQMGIRMVPVYPSVMGLFSSFIDSMYKDQVITEGALYGWFESLGADDQHLSRLSSQAMNPLLTLDLL
jgi:hypothetical protein